jgi:hypothetical protein
MAAAQRLFACVSEMMISLELELQLRCCCGTTGARFLCNNKRTYSSAAVASTG